MEVPATRTNRAITAEEARAALRSLRRSKLIGPAEREAFEWLWHVAGYRAAVVTFTLGDLGAEFGVERRTVRGWVDGLVDVELIQRVDADPRRGTVTYEIRDPNEVIRLVQAEAEESRQMTLLPEDESPEESPASIPLASAEPLAADLARDGGDARVNPPGCASGMVQGGGDARVNPPGCASGMVQGGGDARATRHQVAEMRA